MVDYVPRHDLCAQVSLKDRCILYMFLCAHAYYVEACQELSLILCWKRQIPGYAAPYLEVRFTICHFLTAIAVRFLCYVFRYACHVLIQAVGV